MARNRPDEGCLDRQPQSGGERVEVLPDEREHSPAGRVGLVLVQGHAVDHRVARIARPLGAHHRHPVAGGLEALAFEPDPAVERHRQVLDDDQDSIALSGSRHTG